jgi:hypothetical protein
LKKSAAGVGLLNWIFEALACIFTAGIVTLDCVLGRLFESSGAES